MKRSIVVPFTASIAIAITASLSGCATAPRTDAEPSPTSKLATAEGTRHQSGSPPSITAESLDIKEPADELTLGQALGRALARNPELAAFSWDIRIGQARRLQAGIYPNPEAGVTVENVAGSGGYRGTREAETTLQLSQLILPGGKRGKAIEEARLSRKLAAWDYETVRLDVFSRTADDFVEVLAAQEQLQLDRRTGASRRTSCAGGPGSVSTPPRVPRWN